MKQKILFLINKELVKLHRFFFVFCAKSCLLIYKFHFFFIRWKKIKKHTVRHTNIRNNFHRFYPRNKETTSFYIVIFFSLFFNCMVQVDAIVALRRAVIVFSKRKKVTGECCICCPSNIMPFDVVSLFTRTFIF